MTDLIEINGAAGGGQVLRTALALSAATGRGFHICAIRGRRSRPGLRRQHLACVRAVAQLSAAEVVGDDLGSQELVFMPHPDREEPLPEVLLCDIGSGGSVFLLLQAALFAWAARARPGQRLEVRGGTFSPLAPSAAFFLEALLPRLNAMGWGIAAREELAAFYQTGGGRVVVEKLEAGAPAALHLTEPLGDASVSAEIASRWLPEGVARREAALLRERFGEALPVRLNPLPGVQGAGNAVLIRVRSACGAAVFTSIGQPGTAAEAVARNAAAAAEGFMARGLPVQPQLADQLVVPAALAAGAVLLSAPPTAHLLACAETASRFLERAVRLERTGRGALVTIPGIRK